MQPMPFPIPALFNIAVKDICAINTFEKLFHILLSEVYCSHFGFTTLLLSATTTDMSLYEVLNLFPADHLYFLTASLIARDVVTPLITQANDLEENPGPTIFDAIDPTRTICADHSEGNEALFGENVGKQCHLLLLFIIT